MSALAPGFDPLIAEAKLRMRRRRVLMAVLVLVAGAGVLFLILRPSGAPGTTRVTTHGRNGNGNALAHIKVPVDGSERTWQAGIRAMNRSAQCACGLTVAGERRLDRKVARVADHTGATIVRMKIWPQFGEVELVLATATNPALYLSRHLPRLVTLLHRDNPYVKVVDGKGSSIFEWYYLPHRGMVGVPRRLQACSPVASWGDTPPPCPAT